MKNTTKPQNQTTTPSSRSSSVSTHLQMVELKHKILTSLSKLSDRDTHQIAVEDLEKTIQSLSSDAIPMILNCLYDAVSDPKPSIKNESLRLLSFVCSSHQHSAAPHLPKIISHIIKRLKDTDSASRDACRDSIGAISVIYLRTENNGSSGNNGSLVGLFVKPLFEAMGEQNKAVQAGAAVCMAKMVEATAAVNESGGDVAVAAVPVGAFQKMCPRICKFINNPNFLAKAAILPVVSALSQV
jgi:hypothetical protein